jgi:hypothetical protein
MAEEFKMSLKMLRRTARYGLTLSLMHVMGFATSLRDSYNEQQGKEGYFLY